MREQAIGGGQSSSAREACSARGLSRVALQPPASLYLHIPFCLAKCSYCDFCSFPGLGALHAPYVRALAAELRAVGARWQCPLLQTLYIGGGTPTALPAAHLQQLLEAVTQAFRMAADAEVTLEANPGTVTLEALEALRKAGVNRLSLGVQSFQPAFLRLLRRIHSAAQAAEAVRLARAAGFANVNLDLIYGLPGQTMADWQADLEAALALAPDHLSLYALTLEPETSLARQVACAEVPEPSAELAAGMYEHAEARLAHAGFDHYELSNWARTPALRCRHNLTYWRNLPYAGCGSAAHAWMAGRRQANVGDPREYVARIERGESVLAEEEAISPAMERAETMILGLRLVEGISRAEFHARFGADPAELYPVAIAESVELGLLDASERHIRLTPRGRLLGNQVFMRFLP